MNEPRKAWRGWLAQRMDLPLALAILFFAVFAGSVVTGKIAVTVLRRTTGGVGDVGDFVLLLLATCFFIIACLRRERARMDGNGKR